MTCRPILMSAPMVRAILDGTKTQTRRAIKRQFLDVLPFNDLRGWVGLIQREAPGVEGQGQCFRCRYGVPGDELWVRETWCKVDAKVDPAQPIIYRADGGGEYRSLDKIWKPSIHMRRIDSRITLKISDVRCERLQDISEADAKAEGAAFVCEQCGNDLDTQEGSEVHWGCDDPNCTQASHKNGYRQLWNQINGKDSWSINPFVWALTFEVIK